MFKNLLQEHCQRQGEAFPVYETWRVGGDEHAPLFMSKVKCGSITATSDKQPNKKSAEAEAAQKAYNSIVQAQVLTTKTPRVPLLSPRDLPIVVPPLSDSFTRVPVAPKAPTGDCSVVAKPRSVVLIDGENMPKIVNQFIEHTRGFVVYFFVGEHHHNANMQCPDSVIKVLSPSTRRDGTDTCIQVYVGNFLAQEKFDNYYIVSRDNFAAALADIITAPNMPWVAKSARMITDIKQL